MSSDPFLALALPRDAVLPDYGRGGLFGLVSAIGEFLDGKDFALPVPAGAAWQDDPRARVVVFLLIDGLGDAFLTRHGAGSFLLRHRVGRLTSVFPSTTASAVTTVLTGLPPARHGLTGWFIHDRRFGGVVAPLPMMVRGDGPIEAWFAGYRLFPYRSLFQRRRRPSIFLNPAPIAFSGYSRRHGRGADAMPYEGLDELVEETALAASRLATHGSGYVHAYYPVFDALSHHFGSAAEQVQAQFWQINAAVERLAERLAGAGAHLVVSADHGFTDSPPEWQVDLSAYPEAASMLEAPLFGERRVAFCAVRQGAEGAFEAFAREALAGKAVLVRSGELVEAGLFGPGRAHRRLEERIGTHTLLMEPGGTIRDHVPGERDHAMLGVHGGLSPDEMWIPLIHAYC